jgi:seryl-tRNA synthetase
MRMAKQDMKLIASMYGLEAIATEAEIVNKIKEDKDNIETLTAKLEALEAKNVELQALADEIKQEREEIKKTEIERITDTVIAAGHFDKDQREALIEAAQASFDTFKKMVDGLKPIPAQSLSAVIAQAASQSTDEKHDFEWYRHNDPIALAEMQTNDREKYAKLYAQWEKENI